ncbi:MAG: DEAD/DEAH box helicase family protein [Bacillota bacterium]
MVSSDLYWERLAFASNAVQSIAVQTAATILAPGILVLEVPMGVGKTEAALVAAEIFAAKAKRKGVFFALPTQATSDEIFPRILKWVEKLDSEELHSMRLMHGKAQFNEAYHNLVGGVNVGEDEDGGVIVHKWFEGRKKAMLDDFVVETIDQLLLAALKQKHVTLRHLGLANKVVIIDECHAYDAYMSQYLNMDSNRNHITLVVDTNMRQEEGGLWLKNHLPYIIIEEANGLEQACRDIPWENCFQQVLSIISAD